MKRLELYSWQEYKAWEFSLLIGTNRNKQLEEIKAPQVLLHNLIKLKQVLSRLAKGEYLTWLISSQLPALNLPPTATMKELRRCCKALGLQLQMPVKAPR
jgi:hypothetical protein